MIESGYLPFKDSFREWTAQSSEKDFVRAWLDRSERHDAHDVLTPCQII